MVNDLLYLSGSEIAALKLQLALVREVISEAVQAVACGRLLSAAKTVLSVGDGHSFQSIPASEAPGTERAVAAIKWVSVVAGNAARGLPLVNGIICINDVATGLPLALMDGNVITGIRTAGISALAASLMVAGAPKTLGFIGCGAQASSHLDALADLYPGTRSVMCFGRGEASVKRLMAQALAMGLNASQAATADAVLQQADIVISTVPAAAGLQPFLDARQMKPDATAIMVDLGRSWLPESLSAFEICATDSLDQTRHFYDSSDQPLPATTIDRDLVTMIVAPPGGVRTGRRAFCFRGVAYADLAVARLVHDLARQTATGTILPR